MKYGRTMATLVGVLASLVLAGNALAASTKTQLGPNDKCVHVAVRGWTCLGGDPLFPGGLYQIAKVQHISIRQAFVYAETSSRGNTAMSYADLSASQRAAVKNAVRRGQFKYAPMHYGECFVHMSYGINGTSVDNKVCFLDPRYKNKPAPAFEVDIPILNGDGEVIGYTPYKVPWTCVNFGVKKPTKVTPKTTPKVPKTPKPKPKAKIGHVSVTKTAKDSTGKVMPTPTGTFVFQKVANGLSTKATYNYNPQSLGTCTLGKSVQVSELKPLAGNWKYETPAVQTKKCTSNTHFVFIDQEVVTTTTTPQPTPQEICVSNLGGQWNSDNNTCVIQQGNCSQAVIVIGNGNYVNQGPINCGTTTTTTPTCQTPGSANIGGPLPCVCPSGQVGVPPSCSTPKPVSHSCSPSVSSLDKSDERTATFSVTCDGPIANAAWVFSGNGRSANGTSVTNTFPDNQAGGTATGTVTVLFSDGAPAWTGTVSINIPATPPNGNAGDPPPPPGY